MDTRKLYRSQNDRMIAGVCGGIGRFLHLDATLVRLIFILLFFLGFHGLLAYIIMWIIVPAEPLLVVDQATGVQAVPEEQTLTAPAAVEDAAAAEAVDAPTPKTRKKKPAA